MAENEINKTPKSRSLMQAFVLIFCVAGTIGMVAACGLFAKYYGDNQEYIESRAVVLKGVEPLKESAPPKEVELWLDRYDKAMPGCLCALGRSKSGDTDSAMLLCVGFMKKHGAVACEMKPEKLPPGVTMHISPHENPGRHQKIVFLLSRIFSKRIVASRTGQL
jgi:hypothetical protein